MPLQPGGEGAVALVGPLTEQVLTELQQQGYAGVGQSDVSAVLGLERQKELLGCAESGASCLAELTGAFGAKWLVSGAVSRIGDLWRVDLKLLQAETGHVEQRVGAVTTSAGLFETVGALTRQLLTSLPRPPAPPVRVGAWLAGGLGVALAGVGVALTLTGIGDAGRYAPDQSVPWTQARLTLDGLELRANLGIGLMAAGGAALITSLVLFLLPVKPSGLAMSISAGPGGLFVQGAL